MAPNTQSIFKSILRYYLVSFLTYFCVTLCYHAKRQKSKHLCKILTPRGGHSKFCLHYPITFPCIPQRRGPKSQDLWGGQRTERRSPFQTIRQITLLPNQTDNKVNWRQSHCRENKQYLCKDPLEIQTHAFIQWICWPFISESESDDRLKNDMS